MTAAEWPWPALDAAVARIDAVLAEPEPGSPWVAARYWAGAKWRMEAAARKPPGPWGLVRAAADSPLAAGGFVVETPAAVVTFPPVRKYVAPPVETRPGFLGWLRRRLFGEPPQ
ncbi:hypothetical protein [Amycolatopsis eburnea]|uniref:Uncharacterized protein n=1 Tax=Amycolatopsis eburnea TaxID=2267691 RepID=A0A3R9E8I5_9PSEU|nr:hypothetical protein [Amycolatopsis eburnea]RSD26367.1 hypothetical protein EIY87_00450 [Amycolatopsis eburnea]